MGEQQMNGVILAAVLSLTGSILLCGAVICHERRKTERLYQQILQRLDRAIGGELQETTFDESMDAAITEVF